jgi:hypothetical protein
MENSNNCKKIILFVIPITIWLTYTGVLTDGKFQVSSDELNYFKDLSISFSQGRLNIERPLPWMSTLDLVSFEGKYYLYWPPVPALVYMPFTGIWGRNTPDTVIAGSFGALNVLLLIILLDLFSKRYGLKIGCGGIIFLSVFWALGTVHFYLSRIGNVWCVAQIMAQTFLMLSIIFMLARTSLTTLFLSGLFYSLAVYTRNHLFFSIVLIGAIYVTKDARLDRKVLVRNCLAFLVPFMLFSTANILYNQARFGNAFDNGLKYHRMDTHFAANFQNHGCISLHYVPDNFVREVIVPPPFKSQFPFFDLDPEGFGFLWASPVFIFVLAAAFYHQNEIRRNILGNRAGTVLSRNDIIVMSGAAISGVLIASLIFMIMGTGWMQFASRYSLDYQLVMLLFGIFIVKIWKGRFFKGILVILLLYSIHMNYFGMKYYIHLIR